MKVLWENHKLIWGKRHVLPEFEMGSFTFCESSFGSRGIGCFFFFVVVVLPVLVDFGGFVGAIFSCLLTSEVRTILGWLSLTRPVLFNTKMKTERSYKSWHENSKLLTQIIGAHPILGIISSTLTKKKEREVRMEGAQKAPRFRI